MNTKTVILKEEAVAMFGSQAALARALGIGRQAVWFWKQGEPIPELQAMKLRYQIIPGMKEKADASP